METPEPKPLPRKQEPGQVGMPYWLIPGHRDCLTILNLGAWKVMCLHPIRPENCKDEVWNTLVELNETQEDPMTCPTEGMFNSGLTQ